MNCILNASVHTAQGNHVGVPVVRSAQQPHTLVGSAVSHTSSQYRAHTLSFIAFDSPDLLQASGSLSCGHATAWHASI
jgi:hypothetical protein